MLTSRVCRVDRIVPDIGVEVHLILVADGVGLEEAPDLRIVVAGLVVIEPGFGIEFLARKPERESGLALPSGDAVWGVTVFIDNGAG